ncbi:MAG TPA: hypothetical protein VFE37_18005 [Chloroflexota bacterium]|nr:hypothetical protein [Chloroflexota bacterium]
MSQPRGRARRRHIRVTGFRLTERALDKMAVHGIYEEQLEQALSNPYRVIPNRRSQAAPYLFIGQDNGGACIAAPIFPTESPTTWVPVTAWRCKPSEWARLPPLD